MDKMAFLLSEVFVYKSELEPFVKILVVKLKLVAKSQITITVAFPFISRSSFHDCQCALFQRGLVNSLELALICICARVTSTGVANI